MERGLLASLRGLLQIELFSEKIGQDRGLIESGLLSLDNDLLLPLDCRLILLVSGLLLLDLDLVSFS